FPAVHDGDDGIAHGAEGLTGDGAHVEGVGIANAGLVGRHGRGGQQRERDTGESKLRDSVHGTDPPGVDRRTHMHSGRRRFYFVPVRITYQWRVNISSPAWVYPNPCRSAGERPAIQVRIASWFA